MELRALRVVHNLAVLAVAHAKNLAERAPARVLGHRVIEFPARDEVDVFAGIQRLVGLDVSVGSDKSDLHAGIGFFDLANELQVALQTHGRGEQN